MLISSILTGTSESCLMEVPVSCWQWLMSSTSRAGLCFRRKLRPWSATYHMDTVCVEEEDTTWTMAWATYCRSGNFLPLKSFHQLLRWQKLNKWKFLMWVFNFPHLATRWKLNAWTFFTWKKKLCENFPIYGIGWGYVWHSFYIYKGTQMS